MKINPCWYHAPREDTTPSVLIAEDNPDLSAALKILFGRAGYDVHTAGDGRTTLELARHWQPDLIVLDVSMPGMNGLTT